MLRLLGDGDTILNVLYKEREKPVLFEAAAFHAQYGNVESRVTPPRSANLRTGSATQTRWSSRCDVWCACGEPCVCTRVPG